MTAKSSDPTSSAGDLAYSLRELGYNVVPMVKGPRGTAAPAAAARPFSASPADDETFASWFGPDGAHRNADRIGLFPGTSSRHLYVFEIDTRDPYAMAWWKSVVRRNGIRTDREVTAMTGDHHLRIFLRFDSLRLPPVGNLRRGVRVLGDGDFVAFPVATLKDAQRAQGVH